MFHSSISFCGLHLVLVQSFLMITFYSPTSSFKAEVMMNVIGKHGLSPGSLVPEMVMLVCRLATLFKIVVSQQILDGLP